jgi:hypothetical protein
MFHAVMRDTAHVHRNAARLAPQGFVGIEAEIGHKLTKPRFAAKYGQFLIGIVEARSGVPAEGRGQDIFAGSHDLAQIEPSFLQTAAARDKFKR